MTVPLVTVPLVILTAEILPGMGALTRIASSGIGSGGTGDAADSLAAAAGSGTAVGAAG